MTELQRQIAGHARAGKRPGEIARLVGRSSQYVWTTLHRLSGGMTGGTGDHVGRDVPEGPRCDRCDLLEPHVCLPPSHWYGGARRGT